MPWKPPEVSEVRGAGELVHTHIFLGYINIFNCIPRTHIYFKEISLKEKRNETGQHSPPCDFGLEAFISDQYLLPWE